MKRPERMLACKIIAPKFIQSTIINVLHQKQIFHILAHKKGQEGLDIGSTSNESEKIAEILVKARSFIASFDQSIISQAKSQKSKHKLSSTSKESIHNLKDTKITAEFFEEVNQKIQKTYSELIINQKEQKNLIEQQKSNNSLLKQLKQLRYFDIDPVAINKASSLHAFFGTVKKVDGLESTLKKQSAELSFRRNENFIFVLTSKTHRSNVQQVLTTFGFDSINLSNLTSNLKDQIEQCEKRIFDAEITQIKIDKKNLLLQKSLPIICQYEKIFSIEAKKKELPLQFAVTKKTFIASGWIPKSACDTLSNAIRIASAGKAYVKFIEPDNQSTPPTELTNKRLTKPFEFFLNLYSLPKYSEIDPTFLLFITFPLFFGFMLGDLAYGIILAIVFILLKRKFKAPSAQQIFNVLIFASIVSALFGLAFGEILGFEHLSQETGTKLCETTQICLQQHLITGHGESYIVYEFPRILERAHSHINIAGFEILTILVLGAIIGLIHLNFAFLLGFINEWRGHGPRHAILNKASWILLELGVIGIIFSVSNIFASHILYLSITLTFLAIIMLGLGEGIQGIVEIPALLSNILSYVRLGAVGLASVGLAVVVNENLALPFIHRGGIFILIGIAIMFVGHSINILLGVIGPFLHSLRLHYVEFFSKFFIGGGVEYKPFGKNENTEE